VNRKLAFALIGGLAMPLAAPAAHAQDALQSVQNLHAWFRNSVFDDGTMVLVIRNPSLTAVRVTIRCFATDDTYKTFVTVVPSHGTSEIGMMQGWPNNFVSGEWCQSYFGGEPVWYVKTK
jgi:hypothetical protein